MYSKKEFTTNQKPFKEQCLIGSGEKRMKKNITRMIHTFLVTCLLAGTLTACHPALDRTKANDDAVLTGMTQEQAQDAPGITSSISCDTKFDSVTLGVTRSELEEAGFAFGDSCDISFSNGTVITDVPFYNGYYAKNGDPVLVAYGNEEELTFTRCNTGYWTEAGLSESDTITITRNEQGKYLESFEALSQAYSNDRNDYQTDEQFCNFRSLQGGKLKEHFLYRGTTPVNNRNGRAAYTDMLLKENNIALILDLADNEEDMQFYLAADDFSSDYTKNLYDKGKDILMGMSVDCTSDAYKKSLASGLRFLVAQGDENSKVYIHCTEGKDRTGFVCLLLEALAGASYDELCSDYMKTYENYYGIRKDTEPKKYQAIRDLYFTGYMQILCETEDAAKIDAASYEEKAREYLKGCGMSEKEVEMLQKMICVD